MKPTTTLTFEQVIKRETSHTNGFDYLRLGLSLAVVFVHVTSIASPGVWTFLWSSWTGPVERFVLPSFFALSGYLVTGSLFRNSILQFLALRGLRIFPALAVEVTLSACVFGAAVTTLPVSAYFASPEFHRYFLNIVGIITYTLPGVFDGRAINLQLWTIPFELECYIALTVLALLGFTRHRRLFVIGLVIATVAMTAWAMVQSHPVLNWNVPGRVLVLSFLFGVVAYLFKERIPHAAWLAVVSAVASYLLLTFSDVVFLAAPALAYLTIYIGLLRLPKIPFGDLSYGIYLFHYPIAMMLYESTGHVLSWPMLFLLTLAACGVFASFSWRLVEKPILDRKTQVLAWIERRARRMPVALTRVARR